MNPTNPLYGQSRNAPWPSSLPQFQYFASFSSMRSTLRSKVARARVDANNEANHAPTLPTLRARETE